MKKSEILQQARDMLVRGARQNICHAISGVSMLVPGSLSQCLELRKWIKDMLQGYEFYENWLFANHREFADTQGLQNRMPGSENYWKIALPGRLAWMDWMIEYWQEQEKAEAKTNYFNRNDHGNHPRAQNQSSHQSLFAERDLPAVPGEKKETPF